MTGLRVPAAVAWPSGLLVAAVAAHALTWRPLETAALTVAGATVLVALVSKAGSTALVRALLALLLTGYAFFGRSFAYLGRPPYFVGEMVLVLVLLASLVNGAVASALRSKLVWLLALFAGWGAVRTLPYLSVFGADALRDAAIWGYSAFAVVVVGTLMPCRSFDTLAGTYRKLIPVYLIWILALGAAGYTSATAAARAGGGLSLQVKAGDASVHLAGIGAFLILGLHRLSRRGRRFPWIREWVLWACWVAGFLLFGSLNRGGLLSMFIGLAVVLFLRFRSNWIKLAVVASVGLAVFLVLELEVDVGTTRSISPQQILANLRSVSGDGAAGGEGTRRWRLQWWQTILGYTVAGDGFWRGKGYGANLADEDGFQTEATHALRSAHNGHLTILARSGVPGFALWVLLQAGLWLGLLRAYYRARTAHDQNRADVTLWILAYLSASLANSTFDVYLEGPQGGIWFWAMAGAAMALIAGRPGVRRRGLERSVPLWMESWKMQRC